MYLAGWQKLSLVDYPGKVACTLFTGGCNLRCPYCHNSELLEGDMPRVDTSEVLAYLDHRKGILDGVVVSGGEPCMQPDLLDFLATLKGKNLLVKLDTNGCYPDVLGEALARNLVDYVAMDLKNSPEEYAITTGSEQVPLENIQKAWNCCYLKKFHLNFEQQLWYNYIVYIRSKKCGIFSFRWLPKPEKDS